MEKWVNNRFRKRLAVLILLACGIVYMQAAIKYTTADLNLRAGEGTNYKILTVIPQGTSVQIDADCDCAWIAVAYKGYVGYVSSKYLSWQRAVVSNNHGAVKYYTNSQGNRVQSPTYYESRPAGATALCRDGTYSFSQNRRGTCSHHGGVAKWF